MDNEQEGDRALLCLFLVKPPILSLYAWIHATRDTSLTPRATRGSESWGVPGLGWLKKMEQIVPTGQKMDPPQQPPPWSTLAIPRLKVGSSFQNSELAPHAGWHLALALLSRQLVLSMPLLSHGIPSSKPVHSQISSCKPLVGHYLQILLTALLALSQHSNGLH